MKFCNSVILGKDFQDIFNSAHCGKIQIFVQKIKFSIIPFLAGKFKFNVGLDFIKIEFLDKN